MDTLQSSKLKKQVRFRDTSSRFSTVILLLYLATMPFISAFSFAIISLPLIFSTLLFIMMVVQILGTEKLPDGFLGFDMVIIGLFLLLVIFSYVINGFGVSKSLNHAVAYVSTFLLFYIAIKYTLFSIQDKNRVLKGVLQIITYTTIVSALYANLEFFSSNLFDINLNDYVPRPSESEKFYDAMVVGLFYRSRGFAPESGHFAFMMELFSPLTIYYMYFSGFCKWNGLLKLTVIIAIILSMLFAASSASFVIVPIAVIAAIVAYFQRFFAHLKRQPFKYFLVIAISSFIVAVLDYFFSLYTLLVFSITGKLDSGSFDDRQDRINFFYDKFFHLDPIQKLSGVGPAGFNILGFDESSSILSLYYSLTFEVGILGLFLCILFFFYLMLHTLQNRSKLGFFLMISVISGIIHYYFIANFWYPWFWFIAAFTMFCSKKFSNA